MIHKRSILCGLVFMLLFVGCGCQKTPEQGIVKSKNDGTYEAALQNTVSPTYEPATAAAEFTEEPAQQPAVFSDSFINTDGDISIVLSVEEPILNAALPVLQVRPMEFSGEQVKKMAVAFFGDEPIYENTQQMSKAEIEAAILKLRQVLSDWDGMLGYYGGDESLAQQVKDDYERRIASLETAYQNAPDGVNRVPCAWEFHSDDYYMSPDMASSFVDEGHRYIKASGMINGLPYMLSACNREAEDYRIHNFYIGLDDTVLTHDEIKTISSATPTLEALQAEAQDLISKMDIGQWAPATEDEINVLGYFMSNDSSNFKTIVFSRVFDNVRAMVYPGGLTKADAYASNYYYESISFTFCGDVLYRFEYLGPLQVVNTVNPSVRLLPFNEILSAAEQQMAMVTTNQVALPDGEKVIEVTHAELGLSRIRIKDNATDFYLTPTYAFFGTASTYDANGQVMMNQLLLSDGTTYNLPAQSTVLLAVINAVDGSVIDTDLGY